MPEAETQQTTSASGSDADGWESLRGGGVVRYGTEGVLVSAPPYLYLARSSYLRRYDPRDDTWESFESAIGLPGHVGPGASMVHNGRRHVYLALGDDTRTFCRFNTEARGIRRLARAPRRIGAGGRLAYGDGSVYALRGAETYDFWRYDTDSGTWRRGPRLSETLAPPVGYVSSGLVVADGVLYACPAHRIVWYSGLDERWHRFARLGFRPSCDGGMLAVDEQAKRLYIIQGMGSRTLGVLDLRLRRFHHLRPRLPDAVSVEGERAVVTEVGGVRYLYVYRGHDTDEFWRIRLDALTQDGPPD
ncbi:MAG: hypothetical protein PVH68_09145 [Armatimonadota bacterium]|jgi:hypothetical protein